MPANRSGYRSQTGSSAPRDIGAQRAERRPAPSRADERREDATVGEMNFLTVAEVAALMRVSKMTVYRLVHSGTLPAVRVGRSFRVPENAVHDYLRRSFIEAG